MRRALVASILLASTTAAADLVTPPIASPAPSGMRVSGVVRWRGAPPKPAVANVPADVSCPVRSSQRLMVGSDGGVTDTFVYIEELHGWNPARPMHPSLTHEKCQFAPHVQVVPPGTVLRNGNLDSFIHNTHAYFPAYADPAEESASLFNVALVPLPSGNTFDRRLDQIGFVVVRCDIHYGEAGLVIVSDRPHFALTGSDGKFVIENVPAGAWHLVAWHEGWERSHKATDFPNHLRDPVQIRRAVTVGKEPIDPVVIEFGD